MVPSLAEALERRKCDIAIRRSDAEYIDAGNIEERPNIVPCLRHARPTLAANRQRSLEHRNW